MFTTLRAFSAMAGFYDRAGPEARPKRRVALQVRYCYSERMRFVAFSLCCSLGLGCAPRPLEEPSPAHDEQDAALRAPPAKHEPSSVERGFAAVPAKVRFVAFGGGAEPLSNQV